MAFGGIYTNNGRHNFYFFVALNMNPTIIHNYIFIIKINSHLKIRLCNYKHGKMSIRYTLQKNIVNQYFRPHIGHIIMNYIQDPVGKWSKNNFKLCLKNIEEYGGYDSKYPDIKDNISELCCDPKIDVEYLMGSVHFQIDRLKKQKCSQCKSYHFLYCFVKGGYFKTCKYCRKKGKVNREKKNILKKLTSLASLDNELYLQLEITYFINIPFRHDINVRKLIESIINEKFNNLTYGYFYLEPHFSYDSKKRDICHKVLFIKNSISSLSSL